MASGLIELLSASLAFVGLHFSLSHPLRRPLVDRVGENGFRGIYSLAALGSFVWMVMAFRAVGPGGPALWDGTSDLVWIIASVIMLLASVLLAGSFVRNPALPDPNASKNAALDAHGVFHVTRHPMMWAFALWAAVHVLLIDTGRLNRAPGAGRGAYAGPQEGTLDGRGLGVMGSQNELLATRGRIGEGRSICMARRLGDLACGDLRPSSRQRMGCRYLALDLT